MRQLARGGSRPVAGTSLVTSAKNGEPIADDPLPSFGSDVASRSSDGSILLICPRPKGWLARRGSTLTSSEHPGTAVRWGGNVFEVARSEPLVGGGVRYRLEPWQERHAIRVIEDYDHASEAARAADRVAHGRSFAKRRLAILFSPILGHLPGDVQHRMETEFSAPARGMTVVSAIPVFVWGFLGLMNVLFTLAGGSEAFPWAPPTFFAAYLAAESAVRIGSAWIGGRPMGSLAGVVVWRAVEAALGRKHPSAAAPAVPVPASAEEAATDRYRILEPLLALLPAADQLEIERRFGFEARRWGRVSVAVLLFVGAANALASLLAFAGGAGTAADGIWLAAGLAICAEQLVRRASLARGRPRGSVLGALVRPFAAPLLSPAVPPGSARR